jgi:hypothetical protein
LGDLDPRTALEAARAGLVTAHRQGRPGTVATLLSGLATAAFHTGDWDETVRVLAELLEESSTGHRMATVQALAWLEVFRGSASYAAHAAEVRATLSGTTDAVAQSGLTDLDALEAYVQGRWVDARAAALRSNDLAVFPGIVLLAVRASLMQQDVEAARDTLATFDAMGAHGPAFAAHRLALAAGVAALEGDTAAALQGYRDARAALGALGLRWVLAQTGLEMVTLLPAEPEAVAAAEEARDIMVSAGAAAFLPRLEEAIAAAVVGSTVAAAARTTVAS